MITCVALDARLNRGEQHWSSAACFLVSWPKRSANVASEPTENSVRELTFPRGWVDIKVCAVDTTWSGLKLARRKA